MKSVLVVLPNWFGETLFATPFLAGLRALNPGVKVAATGWPQCEPILRHSPLVDQFIVYDERGEQNSLGARWRWSRALRERRFDAAVVLRKSLSRAVLLALAGIPKRVGWDGKGEWPLTQRFQAAPFGGDATPRYRPGTDQTRQHKAATYLPLLEAFGGPPQDLPLRVRYTVLDAERGGARALLAKEGINAGEPFAVVHPGANWIYKQWPRERMAELARRLKERGLRPVVTGGPADLPAAEAIARDSGGVVLAGKTDIRSMGALLSLADLMVGCDTGITHLATAVGCRTVALYGPTSPVLTGPLGDPRITRVVHDPNCCARIPCFEPEVAQYPGMRAITVDAVFAAAEELLAQPRGASA